MVTVYAPPIATKYVDNESVDIRSASARLYCICTVTINAALCWLLYHWTALARNQTRSVVIEK